MRLLQITIRISVLS